MVLRDPLWSFVVLFLLVSWSLVFVFVITHFQRAAIHTHGHRLELQAGKHMQEKKEGHKKEMRREQGAKDVIVLYVVFVFVISSELPMVSGGLAWSSVVPYVWSLMVSHGPSWCLMV